MTPKQKRFCQEYLVDLNATQAALRVGYSAKTAYSTGQRLLKNVEVQAAIQQGIQERQQRIQIDQDYVIERLRAIAEMDASDAADSELKYSGKLKALELLGKHLGMFEDRLRVNARIDTGKLDSILAQLRETDVDG